MRLQADQVLPAEADRQAKELQAKGSSASVAENAKAEALVNELLSAVWQESGAEAAELFYIRQIETILREAAKVPKRVELENVKVIDTGDGKAIASLVNAYPEIFRQFLDNVDRTLGINVLGSLTNKNGKGE